MHKTAPVRESAAFIGVGLLAGARPGPRSLRDHNVTSCSTHSVATNHRLTVTTFQYDLKIGSGSSALKIARRTEASLTDILCAASRSRVAKAVTSQPPPEANPHFFRVVHIPEVGERMSEFSAFVLPLTNEKVAS
jgi:hypothetical protein